MPAPIGANVIGAPIPGAGPTATPASIANTSWLTGFQNRLAAIYNLNNPANNQTPQAIANNIISAPGGTGLSYGSLANSGSNGGGLGGMLSSAGSGLMTGGQNLLDILSRPLYAVANSAEHQIDYLKAHPGENFLQSLTDPGRYEAGAQGLYKGFTGQEKTTTSGIFSKEVPGYDKLNPFLKFGIGMGGDVGLDPLSYVSPNAVKGMAKGGIAGVAKLLGKDAPTYKFGRAQNAISRLDPVTPADTSTGFAAFAKPTVNVASPTVQAHPQFNALMDHLQQSGRFAEASTPTQPLPFTIAPKAPLSHIADWTKDSPIAAPYERSAGQLADTAMVNTVGKHLDSIPSRVNPSVDIAPIYKDVNPPIAKPTTSEPPVGKTFTPSVLNKTKPEIINDHVNTVMGDKNFAHLYEATGKKAAINPKTGNRISISRERLTELIKKGNISDNSAYTIRTGEGAEASIPLSKFVKDANNDVHLNISPETAVGNEGIAAEKAAAPELAKETVANTPAKLTRLNPVEIAEWKTAHPHVSPEDQSYILKSRNASTAADRITNVKAKMEGSTEVGKIRTIRELEDAISSGRIDTNNPEVQSALSGLASATGKTGYKSGDNAVQAAMKRLEGLQNETHSGAPMTKITRIKGEKKVDFESRKKAETKQFNSRNVNIDPSTTMDALRARVLPLVTNPTADNVASKVIDTKSILEGVFNRGDTQIFNKDKIVLDQAQADAVQSLMHDVTQKEFVDPKTWPYQSGTGVPRTDTTIGLGLGVKKAFNKGGQLTLGKAVIGKASGLIEKGLKGADYSAAMYDKAMPMLAASEQMLRQSGIPIIMSWGKTGIPLSLHDVLSALPRDIVENYFFNASKAIDITQISDLAGQLVRLSTNKITPAEFDATVLKLLSNRRSSQTLDKVFRDEGKAQYSPYATSRTASNRVASAQRIADAFKNAAPTIMQDLQKNSAEALVEVGEHTKELTDAAITKFAQVVLDPATKPGDIIGMAVNPAKLIDEASVGVVNASQDAKNLAKVQLEVRMAGAIDIPATKVAARGASEYGKAITAKILAGKKLNTSEIAHIRTELLKTADQISTEIMTQEGIPVWNAAIRAEYTNKTSYIRSMFPHWGNEDLRPILMGERGAAQQDATNYTWLIRNFSNQFSEDQIKEGMKLIQSVDGNIDPSMKDVTDGLSAIWNRVLGDAHPVNGFLGRNGVTPEELNKAFAHYGISNQYKVNPMDIANSWRTWDIKDPLDLAARVHAGVQSIIAEHTLGSSITLRYGEKLWKPGLVRVANSGGKSRIASLMDLTKFYPEDIARQLGLVDKTLEEFSMAATKSKFLKTIDSVLHSYKAGLTIYRFGHHMRNQIGDMWMSAMDGMWNPKYYFKSLAVMATRKSQYSDFDVLAALRDATTHDLNPDATIFSLTHRGKRITWNADGTYKAAYQGGNLPNFNIGEDLSFDPALAGTDMIGKIRSRSPFGGHIHNIAAGVSMYREHNMRIAHFIYAMEKTGLDSSRPLDEAIKIAIQKASQRVRKWHPDGSDMALGERRVAKRAILFYSWIRKAIPLVVESAVTHPGRFMVYPKATYNMAEANGIKLQGIGDQFPIDQLFPSYMLDATQGPLWGKAGSYMGAKPGVPSADVLEGYATSPMKTLQTIAGSANPFLKVPFELATGHSASTGGPITDKAGYVDQQIPFANLAEKLTGRSVSTGFTQKMAVAPTNVGYKSSIPPWLLTMLNMNSGLGVNDMSKPSAIKQGQIELKGKSRIAKPAVAAPSLFGGP